MAFADPSVLGEREPQWEHVAHGLTLERRARSGSAASRRTNSPGRGGAAGDARLTGALTASDVTVTEALAGTQTLLDSH